MKELAGVYLLSVDIDSTEDLQKIYTAFEQNYCQHYIRPDGTNAELVVKYLDNFLRANTITRCATQDLAFVLKYLPTDDELIHSMNKNDSLTLLALKINLRQAGCSDQEFMYSDFKQRCALIERLKRKICFHKDWDGYVARVAMAFNRKSFELVQIKLAEIANMKVNKNATKPKEYLPFLLSLQICQYIQILQFIDKHQLEIFDQVEAFVKTQIKSKLDLLIKLPELKNEEERTSQLKKLRAMLFSCNSKTKNNQIAPELSEPLLGTKLKI